MSKQQSFREASKHLGDALGEAPTVFVPPWNSYDNSTLVALIRAGFKGLSANRYSPISKQGEELRYAPMTIEIKALRRSVELAAASTDKDPVIGVMLHPYDFNESGDSRSVISLAEFEKVLAWIAEQEGVCVRSISSLITESPAMNAKRFSANKSSFLEPVFPSIISKVGADPIYGSEATALRRRTVRHLQLMAFLLLVALLGGIGGSLIGKALDGVSGFFIGVMLFLAGFLVIRAIYFKEIYSRALTLITLLSGACLGLLLA